jgi:hypothetical protein
MPLSGNILSTAIKARLDAELGMDLSNSYNKVSEFVDILSTEIINHIKLNAVVSSSVAVLSVAGVTTGPGISGPGTGTATGTIQ